MDKKANVLLIFADQQHWKAMGFMDASFNTPNLDQLSEESVVFDHSFCTTAQCSPSRSSLLTGFYPSSTRVMGNTQSTGGVRLVQPTVALELQAAGYHTGYFGKWHLGDDPVGCAGWDKKDFSIDDPKTTENAIQFLKSTKDQDKPFSLFVSINNPHDIYKFNRHESGEKNDPLPSTWSKESFKNKPPIQEQFMTECRGTAIHGKPEEEWKRYRDCYRKKTRLYDSHLGEIIDELKAQKQWENTIIIVTSDHGDMDGNHRLIFKGPFMYDHMVRIPLMIRVPPALGGLKKGRVDNTDIVNVDIVPTIRDLCGMPAKPSHGTSLAPLLLNEGEYLGRDFVIAQYYSKQSWVNPIRMIRTKAFKFNRHIRWKDELYDLVNDPEELNNLNDDPAYSNIKSELLKSLDQWILDNNDPFYSLPSTMRSGEFFDNQ